MLRNDINDLMNRTIRFFSNNRVGEALIIIQLPFDGYYIPPLDKWRFPEQLFEYLDMRIEWNEAYWKYREGIEDDKIPTNCPWFGYAEHAAFIGGKVEFSKSTSWLHPILKNWDDLDKLELNEDNTWLRMIIDGLCYMKERSEERCVLELRGVMCPLDIANAVRGNDIFTDFFEYPEELHRLLEFSTLASEWFISHQKDIVGEFRGGTVLGSGIWMPGNSIGHLSEDASVMCSPPIYREFGKPYTEKLTSKYEHSYMHLHGAGAHVFPDIAGIKGIDCFDITNDPNKPRSIDIYKQLFKYFTGKLVKLYVSADEIRKNIEFLKNTKTLLICRVESIDEAIAATQYVRRELAIK